MPLSRTAIYLFGVGFTLLAYLDPTGALATTTFGVSVKYLYTLLLLSFIVYYLAQGNLIASDAVAPLMALGFFLITTAVFIINFMAYGYKMSYASAFTSSLFFAAAAFIPRAGLIIDVERILNQLLIVLLLCSLFYILEAILRLTALGGSYFALTDTQFAKTIVTVTGLSLAILARRRLFVLLYSIASVSALLLRPSSTMVLALVVCVPLSLLLRMRMVGIGAAMTYGFVLAAALSPLALYLYADQIGEAIGNLEGAVKTDILGSRSNTEFRMLVITLALRQLAGASLFFGSGLDGNVTVFVGRELPYWFDMSTRAMATIHSDFVIILTQSGLIGYLIFVAFLFIILNVRFRSLIATRFRHQGAYDLVALSVVAVVCFVIYSLVNPNMQYYYVLHPVWMLLFISELIAGARIVTREMVPRTPQSQRIGGLDAGKDKQIARSITTSIRNPNGS
jgi:hypothetical protein